MPALEIPRAGAANSQTLPSNLTLLSDDQVKASSPEGYGKKPCDVTSGRYAGGDLRGRPGNPVHDGTTAAYIAAQGRTAPSGLPSDISMVPKEVIAAGRPPVHKKPPPKPKTAVEAAAKNQFTLRASSARRTSTINSSEFLGRVDALALQFEEERKRRQTVERRIAELAMGNDVPRSPVKPILRENVLAAADETEGRNSNVQEYLSSYTPPLSGPASDRAKKSMKAPAPPKRRAASARAAARSSEPSEIPSIPSEAAAFMPFWMKNRGTHAMSFSKLNKMGPDVRKPRLPAVARGVRSGLPGAAKCVPSYQKKRVPGVELYAAHKRHEQRMHSLEIFEAQMLAP